MTAFNVVKFDVKPECVTDFIALTSRFDLVPGCIRRVMIKTGETTFCTIGEWHSTQDLVDGRAASVSNLEKMRPILNKISETLGVTDAVSGETVYDLPK